MFTREITILRRKEASVGRPEWSSILPCREVREITMLSLEEYGIHITESQRLLYVERQYN